MSQLSEKTTIYLDPRVKKFIQHKAVADQLSVSQIINDYFADMSEDLEDIATIKARRSEPDVTFEDALRELGLSYDDLRSKA